MGKKSPRRFDKRPISSEVLEHPGVALGGPLAKCEEPAVGGWNQRVHEASPIRLSKEVDAPVEADTS
jgi:hypothetical protein